MSGYPVTLPSFGIGHNVSKVTETQFCYWYTDLNELMTACAQEDYESQV